MLMVVIFIGQGEWCEYKFGCQYYKRCPETGFLFLLTTGCGSLQNVDLLYYETIHNLLFYNNTVGALELVI